jgi:quinol monooxygenase YgiN
VTVALIVKWVAAPGAHDVIADVLRTMRVRSLGEPGCLSYEVYQSSDDPHEFMLVERYRDQAAIKEHGETEYFKEYVLGRAMPSLKSRQRGTYTPLET